MPGFVQRGQDRLAQPLLARPQRQPHVVEPERAGAGMGRGVECAAREVEADLLQQVADDRPLRLGAADGIVVRHRSPAGLRRRAHQRREAGAEIAQHRIEPRAGHARLVLVHQRIVEVLLRRRRGGCLARQT